MRYCDKSNKEIMESTGLSRQSIVTHIKNWNKIGIDKAIEDHRGGSESKLEPEIVDDLVKVVLKKSPVDFEFTCHTWTLDLLALYVEKTYGIKVCNETIRSILISHNISYKRAQPKPTKADKAEQESFKKKMPKLLDTLESSSDIVVYALDETGISIESDNYSSWSPVGNPPT